MPAVERGHPILFATLALFSFIELIITAVLVAHNNRWSDSLASREAYLLFVSIWTFIFSIGYIVGFLRAPASFLMNIASHAGFLALTFIFWLAGAAAVTDTLDGGLNCSNWDFSYCGTLNASEAFAWINTIITFFGLILVILLGVRSSKNGTGWGSSLA
ncbi:hypothetical protein BT69DRAFT_1269024 [Atractiella rhizophila]|nr:hypothetical protein BT69DRAFT_1269024 [Atractiella rhizophila]